MNFVHKIRLNSALFLPIDITSRVIGPNLIFFFSFFFQKWSQEVLSSESEHYAFYILSI